MEECFHPGKQIVNGSDDWSSTEHLVTFLLFINIASHNDSSSVLTKTFSCHQKLKRGRSVVKVISFTVSLRIRMPPFSEMKMSGRETCEGKKRKGEGGHDCTWAARP